MMKHQIDIAYEYAKKKFHKKPFSLNEFINNLLKVYPKFENNLDDFYVDLIQDMRFISLGQQKWALRENYTLSEINKITASIFGIEEYYEKDVERNVDDEEVEKFENDFIDQDFLENDSLSFIDEDDKELEE